MGLSRFGPSAVLKQIMQIHCMPKSVRVRPTALMDSKRSSQKTTESAHGLQSSEGTSRLRTKKPVRILRESQGWCLQIANQLDQNLSESSCLATCGVGLNNCLTLKTITSSNKESRLLTFHFPQAILVFGDNEPKCSKCYDRKDKIAFRTSKYCNR